MVAAIIFLSSLIIITYVIFPVVTISLAALKKSEPKNDQSFKGRVFLFMSAHNESEIIGRKLDSLVNSNFPPERLICFIGSDASTDGTVSIIQGYQNALQIHLEDFQHRQGKPATINQLVELAYNSYKISDNDLFFMTDANVVIHPEFIRNLSGVFTDENIGIADGIVANEDELNTMVANEGRYMKWETELKYAEGILWGCAMGPFGGAYMIRPRLVTKVPKNFLVDDFFIFYHAIKSGKQSIVVRNAQCYESVGSSVAEEFRRKVRISTGNYQNIAYYFSEIVCFWKPRNLIFIMHKFLRWMTPVLAVLILLLLVFHSSGNPITRHLSLIMISLLVGIPLLNYLLDQVNLSVKWLTGFSYFIIMNLALLLGFFKFLSGVKSNVWEPTKRNTSA